MKRIIKLTALALTVAMLTSTLAGCGLLFGGGDDYEEPTEAPTEAPEPEFDPPYYENYYVNKHTPVMVSGNMEVFKYDKDSEAIWMGGHAYNGGFRFWGDPADKYNHGQR